MQSETRSPDLYEHVIVANFLLFLRSMQLYGQVSNRAIDDPSIFRNPKIQKGLLQIIETVQACGDSLERLPPPPSGAEGADQCFRELGKDLYTFAGLLKDLANISDEKNKKQTITEFQVQSERVRQNFREAILSYERAYPGRFTNILKSQQLQTQ